MRPSRLPNGLEPLAVETDGGTIAPILVRPARGGSPWRDATAIAATVARSWIDDLVGGAPGTTIGVAPPPTAVTSAARQLPVFLRMIEVQTAALGELPAWWDSSARRRVAREMGWSLDELHAGAGGAWRVRGRMHRTRLRRRVPFDLLLWPHLGVYTKLVVEPRRHVHVSRRYFRRGHCALDRLAVELEALAQPTPVGRCL